MVGADLALVEQSAGGADLDAFSAACAGRFSPWLIEVGDDHGVNAAAHHIPDVRALNLGADADAAGAEDAAIVVERETFVRSIDGQRGVAIGQLDVRDTLLLAERLQFAVAVGNA